MIEFHRYRISGCTSTIENMDAKMFVEMCAVSIFPQTRQSESDEITLLVTWNIRVLLLIIILDAIRFDTGFRAFFRSFFFSLLSLKKKWGYHGECYVTSGGGNNLSCLQKDKFWEIRRIVYNYCVWDCIYM